MGASACKHSANDVTGRRRDERISRLRTERDAALDNLRAKAHTREMWTQSCAKTKSRTHIDENTNVLDDAIEALYAVKSLYAEDTNVQVSCNAAMADILALLHRGASSIDEARSVSTASPAAFHAAAAAAAQIAAAEAQRRAAESSDAKNNRVADLIEDVERKQLFATPPPGLSRTRRPLSPSTPA